MKKRYWTVVQPMSAAALAQVAREAEDAGLEGIWVPQLYGPPFPTMGAIAMASRTIKIGSGIALAFSRSPLETALNAIDLDIISGGRIVLGIGTSLRNWNEDMHGVAYGKPLANLREVVRIVRDVIEKGDAGGLGIYEGEFHRADLRAFKNLGKPVRKSIPILLPALFETTIKLAAEIGDGVIGHPVWSLSWVKNQMAPMLQKQLPLANRKREEFHVNLWVYTAIAPDRSQAIDDARGTVAFYSSIAQYEKYFAAHGFGAEARAAADAARRNDGAAMLAAIPDEMVNAFALAGTPNDARVRIEEMWQCADSITLMPPNNFLRADRIEQYRKAIAETFFKA